jgi:hypothetical protein
MRTVNTCGHPDRPHLAKGKCRSCYYGFNKKIAENATPQKESERLAQALKKERERRVSALEQVALAEVVIAHYEGLLDASLASEAEAAKTEAVNQLGPYMSYLVKRQKLDWDPDYQRDSSGERPPGYWKAVNELVESPPPRPANFPPQTLEWGEYQRGVVEYMVKTDAKVVGTTVGEDGLVKEFIFGT